MDQLSGRGICAFAMTALACLESITLLRPTEKA
jgi:hypothetical protein